MSWEKRNEDYDNDSGKSINENSTSFTVLPRHAIVRFLRNGRPVECLGTGFRRCAEPQHSLDRWREPGTRPGMLRSTTCPHTEPRRVGQRRCSVHQCIFYFPRLCAQPIRIHDRHVPDLDRYPSHAVTSGRQFSTPARSTTDDALATRCRVLHRQYHPHW